MKVYAVVGGFDYPQVEAIYARREDAERHVAFSVSSDEDGVEEWDVWEEFLEQRFTKKGYLRVRI